MNKKPLILILSCLTVTLSAAAAHAAMPSEAKAFEDIEIYEGTDAETDEIPFDEVFIGDEEPDFAQDLDMDSLFADYAERVFEEEDTLSSEACATDRREYLREQDKKVYDILAEHFTKAANGEISNADIFIPTRSYLPLELTAADFGVSSLNVSGDALSTLMKNRCSVDMNSVLSALQLDMPYEIYWYDKVNGLRISTVGWSYRLTSSGGNRVVQINDNNGQSGIKLHIYVSSDYSVSGGQGTSNINTAKTGAAKRTSAKVSEVVNAAIGRNDYEKLLFYRDWIRSQVTYNYDAYNGNAPYGDPWQVIYVFDGNPNTNVVCEGYSKAFKLLCDRSRFVSPIMDCYLAMGVVNGGNHMWNIMAMNDGKNYVVDLTNYEENYPTDLFLSGYAKKLNNGYGFKRGNTIIYYYYNNYETASFTSKEMAIEPQNYTYVESVPAPGAADEAAVTALVTRLYADVLQRNPDPSGLSYWVDNLISGSTTGATAAYGFYFSDEIKNRGISDSSFIDLLYIGLLGRAPDAQGKAYWLERIENGVTREFLFASFVASKEFDQLCSNAGIAHGSFALTQNRDKNYGITQFVSRLYNKALGRGYDNTGINYWCGKLLEDGSRSNLIRTAANGFLHSKEFLGKNLSDEEYIRVLYRTFLGREADNSGLQYWLGQLRSGKSRDDILPGFAYSNEFGNIMAQYGL